MGNELAGITSDAAERVRVEGCLYSGRALDTIRALVEDKFVGPVKILDCVYAPEYGRGLVVLEHDGMRSLATITSSNLHIQSRMDLDRPERLVLQYQRLMSLGLAFTKYSISNATILGLGGSDLWRYLWGIYRDAVKITTVEFDPVIADMAEKWFQFTGSVILGDAKVILPKLAPADILFVDINDEAGAVNANQSFWGACLQHPVVVINWTDYFANLGSRLQARWLLEKSPGRHVSFTQQSLQGNVVQLIAQRPITFPELMTLANFDEITSNCLFGYGLPAI